MRIRTLGCTVVLAVTCAAGATVTVVGTASAIASCQGERATLVGEQDGLVNGTSGRDVVVTNGASSVSTGAGDDLVCITGSTPAPFRPVVTSGPGDDRVVNASGGPSIVYLGTGRDDFRGGAGADQVTASGRDVVRTGGGADDVYVTVGPAHGLVLDGGPGRDRLRVTSPPGRRLVVDNARRLLVLGATEHPMRWFESFDIGDSPRPQDFVGGPGAETVHLVGSVGEVQLGDGDDQLEVYEFFRRRLTLTGALRGGGGTDRLSLKAVGSATVDLLRGRLTMLDGDLSWRATIGGWNQVDVVATDRFDLVGTPDDETVSAYACRGLLDLRGGDDDASVSTPEDDGTELCRDTDSYELRGGAGDDVLVGGALDDTLVGGDGDDVADGRGGTNDCDAETTTNCGSLLPLPLLGRGPVAAPTARTP